MARVVFFGTPEYALPALLMLLAEHDVIAVVTQPDRPAGRGRQRLAHSPVKQVALAHSIEVLQPARLRRYPAVMERLQSLGADVFVLAAYGQILTREVLEIPPHGVIGLHASLLPRWRGAAPVAAAILNGDRETGVTLMLTDEGMDTGDIIAQRAVPILDDDTQGTLTARLAEEAAALLSETLPAWLEGRITAFPQDEDKAAYAPPLRKEDGRIDWTKDAAFIERQVRAMTPWPGAYTMYQGKPLKILRARYAPANTGYPPGTVVWVDGSPAVSSGEGALLLLRLQAAGRRAMEAEEFVRGQPGFVGSRLD